MKVLLPMIASFCRQLPARENRAASSPLHGEEQKVDTDEESDSGSDDSDESGDLSDDEGSSMSDE